jgi:NADH:ubiquinone oxidoreductase subunit 4 (subunit M)
MILVWFIIVPAAGGLLAWFLGRMNSTWPKWVALSAMVINLITGVFFAFERVGSTGPWLAEIQLSLASASFWLPTH